MFGLLSCKDRVSSDLRANIHIKICELSREERIDRSVGLVLGWIERSQGLHRSSRGEMFVEPPPNIGED